MRTASTQISTTNLSGEKRTEVGPLAQLRKAYWFARQRVVFRQSETPPTNIAPGAELETDIVVDAERSKADRFM